MDRSQAHRSGKCPGLILVALIAASISLAPCVAAGGIDSRGTEFWLMFNANYELAGSRTIFITSDVDTEGTVEIPGLGFAQPFTVTAGTVTSVDLPLAVTMTTSDVIEAKGIHVTAGEDVSVYGLNQQQYTTDAFLGLPTDVLGTNHIVLAHPNGDVAANTRNNTQFGIAATVDDTVLTITPAAASGTHSAGVSFDITLDAGDSYQLRSTDALEDLTGTTIVSSQPVAVFGSHSCGNVPSGIAACDHMVEQLPPTSAWGRRFASMPLATRLNGDTFRVLAQEDGTNLSVNGALVATLARGGVHEQIIAGPALIEASAPVLVAQLSNGSNYDGVVSDPFMMLVPPLEQFLGEYTVTTPATGFTTNFVNLVVPDAAIASLTHNGAPVSPAIFTPIDAGLSGAQVAVALGSHSFSASLPFGVFVYGFASFDSYGYPGGLSVAEIARVTTISLDPETATHTIGTEGCIGASVTDQNDDPLEGIRVDFAVTGTNPNSGFAFTGADGIAPFCYTGTAVGDDSIAGSVADLSDTVAKTWVDPLLAVTMDIKFLGAPNPFNCSAKGVVPVTLFGTAQFDVTGMDLATLRLERLDGTGGAVGPVRAYSIQDRGNPLDAGINFPSLRIYNPDGFLDIDVGFDIRAVARLIGCAGLAVGATSPQLIVTGQLADETPFVSQNYDTLLIKQK